MLSLACLNSYRVQPHNMMKVAFINILLAMALSVATAALAQPQPVVEQGTPEELRGVTKIYIDVYNRDDRRDISSYIKKKLPGLKITDSPAEAEVWLRFKADTLNYPGNSTTAIAGATIENYEIAATGFVVKPLGKGRVRVLMSFESTVKSITYPQLSTKFARRFTKAYQRANER